jgi:hypothetical protein
VLKRRVGKIESSHLTRPNAVTQPCELDGRLLNEVERVSYGVAPQFEAIELAPLAPLGAIATLTGLDQGNVLSAIRAFECASDPTVGLALECVYRRKDITGRKETTRLCRGRVMSEHLLIAAIDVRLIAIGLSDAALEIVWDDQLRDTYRLRLQRFLRQNGFQI